MTPGEAIEALPGAAKLAAEIVVDNPASCAVIASTVILAPRVAGRLVRPRGFIEALALAIVLEVGLVAGLKQAVGRGWLPLYLRGGCACGARIPLHGGIVSHGGGCNGTSRLDPAA